MYKATISLAERRARYAKVFELKQNHQFISNAEIGRQLNITATRVAQILKEKGEHDAN